MLGSSTPASFEDRADLEVEDKVGQVVEVGWVSIDDYQVCAFPLGRMGKPAAGYTTREEPIAGRSHCSVSSRAPHRSSGIG
jgi:hypothetical protein